MTGVDHPVVGVGAVVVHEGRVVLVQRGKEPLRGQWIVPGGTVEAGETLQDAVVREVWEETGLAVRPLEVALVFDRIERRDGKLAYHYVVIDYLCECIGGTLRAGSDASAVVLAAPEELCRYALPDLALDLVCEGFRRAGVLLPPGLADRPAPYMPLATAVPSE
jgi:8-oxo-dGTP diphosphatase